MPISMHAIDIIYQRYKRRLKRSVQLLRIQNSKFWDKWKSLDCSEIEHWNSWLADLFENVWKQDKKAIYSWNM